MSFYEDDVTAVPGELATAALMQRILGSIEAVFESADVELPGRRYTTVGSIAHDCEQVVVSFIQMYLGAPGAQSETPQKCDAPRSAVITVHIVRCIPTPPPRSGMPRASDISNKAEEQTRDAWLLMDAALGPIANEWIGAIADVSVSDPQGGYQAVMLNLTVAVP